MVTDKKTEVKAFICNVHPGDRSRENIFLKLRNSRRVLEASAISLKLRKMWFYFTLHKMVGQYVNCRLPNEFISKYYKVGGAKNLEGDEWGETIRRCYNFPQTTRRYKRNIHQLIENFQIERPERNPRQNLNFLNWLFLLFRYFKIETVNCCFF